MELRPRFAATYSGTKEAVFEFFKEQLAQTENIKAAIWEDHLVLKIPREEQHYWSPQLTLSFEEEEEGVTIRGLCGPKPTVWMMFVFFYFLLGFAATVIMIMGFAQMNLGLPAGILWLLPVIGFIVAMVYWTARMGQKFSKDEMARLYQFYGDTTQNMELIARP